MHRDGLFFDPLDTEADVHAPEPERGPGPDDPQVQRRRELARVQDELRRMSQGRP
ncbi:hypothetical protein [Arthrobacter antioxidans]|uniref:hypothetical protein n=1 Tax=Arthrobacter antioxidans TaxID=2895818 RepID=UPI001FFE5A07|nr:hypothetical protein [Arthrobacter antioxidans]